MLVRQPANAKKEMSDTRAGLKLVVCALDKVYTVVFLLPRVAEYLSSTQHRMLRTGYLLSTLLDKHHLFYLE